MIDHLLDVDVHLSEDRRRDCVAVALAGQNGHAALDAQRLEDGFRDPVGETVERADDDDSIVALTLGIEPFANRRDDFTIERGGNVFRGFREQCRDIVWPGDQQPGPAEQTAVVFLGPALHPITQPLLQAQVATSPSRPNAPRLLE